MMKIIFLFLLLFFLYTASAQTERVPQVATENVPPEKDEDRGRIEKRSNKYGIVTANGFERVPIIYDSLIEITGDVIVAYKKGKCGIITRDNKTVAPFIYDRIMRFNDSLGYLKTSVKGKHGVITFDGEVVVEPTYEEIIWNKTGNFFLVNVENKMGVVSTTGDVILKPIVADYIPAGVWGERAAKYFYYKMNDRWGLVNPDGMILIPATYGHLHYMEEHKMFLAQSPYSTNSFAVIDDKNNVVVPMQNIQFMVSPNFMIIRRGNLYGVINALSKEVVPFGKYDDIVATSSGDCIPRMHIKLKGKRGVMDEKGNLLTEIKYDYLGVKNGCFIEYKINQQLGLLDQFGKTVLEGKFKDFVIWPDKERILASDESGIRLHNFHGKQLSPNIFEEIGTIGSRKFFSFVDNGKYGLITIDGEIVVKPEFDKIFEKRYSQKDIFGQQNGRRVLLVTE